MVPAQASRVPNSVAAKLLANPTGLPTPIRPPPRHRHQLRLPRHPRDRPQRPFRDLPRSRPRRQRLDPSPDLRVQPEQRQDRSHPHGRDPFPRRDSRPAPHHPFLELAPPGLRLRQQPSDRRGLGRLRPRRLPGPLNSKPTPKVRTCVGVGALIAFAIIAPSAAQPPCLRRSSSVASICIAISLSFGRPSFRFTSSNLSRVRTRTSTPPRSTLVVSAITSS